ncbi:putative ATP-binding protein [Nannochloris sp. 'desiccata']|nr:putative ATP-binding protein [Chlorella desiccata (nom. nud.)]
MTGSPKVHHVTGGKKVCLAGVLRPRLRVKASAASGSLLSALKDQIFNRKDELAALKRRFDEEPSELLILLGPANCGKTKLLEEVKKYRELGQAVIGDGPPPIIYLDCRGQDITSPQQFANAIRELITEDAGLQDWWKDLDRLRKASKFKLPGYEADLGELFASAADKPPMASIIASLTKFLEATRPLPYKPVIIIDEANVMMDWHGDPGRTQLKALLRFFVKTTKQAHLGHIVLASSESFVIDFLENEGLHTKNYITQAVGDLATIDEAKEYIESRMHCKKAPPSFFDTTKNGEQIDMWPRVYEVCGGNIGLLERCSRYAKIEGSWEEGLKTVGMDPEDAVQRGLWPKGFSRTGGSRSPPAWTKEDYKTVSREIALAEEHRHAVSFDKLRNMLGEEAVLSMLEWNLVALRRKSSWAKDLPETLFSDLKDTKLVTMPSPVESYFVLKMFEAGKLDCSI